MADNTFLIQVLLDARQREFEKIEAAKSEITYLNQSLIELGVDMPDSDHISE